MRSALFSIALLLQSINVEPDLWQGVGHHPTPVQSGDVHLSVAQENLVKVILKQSNRTWQCAFEDPRGEWAEGLRFKIIPLSNSHRTILVEAGPGCARGARGSNGAMWVVQLGSGKPTVLASPVQDFNGWLYSIQPSSNRGYKDIVIGWHMNAGEAGLSYFRFDGTQYNKLSGATIQWDGSSGHGTITPDDNPQH